MSTIDSDVATLLLQHGAKAPAILNQNGDGDPLIVVPNGMRLESLKPFLPPMRIEQTVILQEAGSFINYVNRFKDEDTLIFSDVSETGATFRAVLDYHCAQKDADIEPIARYCKHVARFTAVETPEWKVWRGANRLPMSQVDFASFLEDNANLFVNPKGADLLELVRTLHGHVNARFNTALRMDNGAYSVSYEEDISVKGTAGSRSGDIKLPPEIVAGFSIFQGAAPYKVTARLKSRVAERQLKLYFETIQLQAIVRESILLLVNQVAEKTGIKPLIGSVA